MHYFLPGSNARSINLLKFKLMVWFFTSVNAGLGINEEGEIEFQKIQLLRPVPFFITLLVTAGFFLCDSFIVGFDKFKFYIQFLIFFSII